MPLETKTPGMLSGRDCPVCHSALVWRVGRYSTFEGCSRYPICKGKIGSPRGKYASKSAETPETPKTEESMGNLALSTTKTEESMSTTPNTATLADVLFGALRPALIAEIRDAARSAATKALAEAQNTALKIEWTVNMQPFAETSGATHPALKEILRRVKAGLNTILLVGPAGSGKTRLAADLAAALQGRDFASVSCTAGMPEWHLVGRSTPNLTTGDSSYAISDFVRLYESGGVFLADELDAADPNTLLVINSALANGHMPLPSRQSAPVAKRHQDFIFIAAANTYGHGASRQYVGRNQLDASTLSRFACAVVAVDYDEGLERALVTDELLREKVWSLRTRASKLGIRQVVGTRELLHAARLVASGETIPWTISALTAGWTEDERTKVQQP